LGTSGGRKPKASNNREYLRHRDVERRATYTSFHHSGKLRLHGQENGSARYERKKWVQTVSNIDATSLVLKTMALDSNVLQN
jgi:hypothetical protein